MSSLAAALAGQDFTRRPGPRCSVCTFLDELSEVDRVALVAEFDNPANQHESLARFLRAEGFHVGGQTLARHRKAECGR